MSAIAIKVDGVSVSVKSDIRPTQLFAERKEVIVCKVNGVLKDLWTELAEGDSVESVSISSPEGLSILRHSTAHVMAQAVQQTFAITANQYFIFSPYFFSMAGKWDSRLGSLVATCLVHSVIYHEGSRRRHNPGRE